MALHLHSRKRVIPYVFLGLLVLAAYFDNPVTRRSLAITRRSLAISNKARLPLKYPFFICQFGKPRTASTFQAELLKAIVHLKSPPGINIPIISGLPESESKAPIGIMKTHSPTIGTECVDRGYPIFTSDRPDDLMHIPGKYQDAFKVTLHNQSLDKTEKCSLCQVDYYQPIFALSDEEVAMLKRYMSLYEKIRQCCGLQMSKYNMARLHGCDVTPYRDLPAYPMCELNNMQEVEKLFHEQPIAYEPSRSEWNWAQPGDCAKFDDMVINGQDFNGKKWDNKCP